MLDEVGAAPQALLEIPVYDVGPGFALATLNCVGERGRELFEVATAGVPTFAIRLGDAVARRWLARWQSPYLLEIDEIAARARRPGAHYYNVQYEWGCTTAALPSSQGTTTRLVRVLDWRTNGLGRYVIAARIPSRLGPWISLTWPGYTGVMQALAPGRFAAAINQAPMRGTSNWRRLDWALEKWRVWRSPHLTPAHLLRRVFERARDFAEAKAILTDTPICAPVIYTLAGVAPGEVAVIERRREAANVIETDTVATNDWRRPAWRGRRYPGRASDARALSMASLTTADMDQGFPWLSPPILNDETRLVMVADAAEGRLIAQGYEACAPATRVLDIKV